MKLSLCLVLNHASCPTHIFKTQFQCNIYNVPPPQYACTFNAATVYPVDPGHLIVIWDRDHLFMMYCSVHGSVRCWIL